MLVPLLVCLMLEAKRRLRRFSILFYDCTERRQTLAFNKGLHEICDTVTLAELGGAARRLASLIANANSQHASHTAPRPARHNVTH